MLLCSNNAVPFTNVTSDDLMFYTDCNTQSIHIGVNQCNVTGLQVGYANGSNLTTVGGNINISGRATVGATLVASNATLSNTTLYGTTTACNNVNVFGAATISNVVNVSSNLNVSGVATFSNTLNVTSNVTAMCNLTVGSTLIASNATLSNAVMYGTVTSCNAMNVYGIATHSNNVIVAGNASLTVASNLIGSNISACNVTTSNLVACNITVSNITACNITYINETVTNTTESGVLTIAGTGSLMSVGPATFSNTVTILSNVSASCNLSVGSNITVPYAIMSNLAASNASFCNLVSTAGLIVNGNLLAHGMLSVDGTINTYSDLNVISSNIYAYCNVTVGKNLIASNAILSNAVHYGTTTACNALNVYGVMSVSNNLNASSNIIALCNITAGSTLIASNATLSNTSLYNTTLVYGATTFSNNVGISSNYTLTVGCNMISSNILASNVTICNQLTVNNLNFTGTLQQNGATYIASQWTTSGDKASIAITSNVNIVGNFAVSNVSTLSNVVASNVSVAGQFGASNATLSNVTTYGTVTSCNAMTVFGAATFSNNVGVSSNYTLTVGSNLVSSNINASNVTVANTLTVNNLNFTGTLQQNGATYVGSQWVTASGGASVSITSNVNINGNFAVSNVSTLSNVVASNVSVAGQFGASNAILSNVSMYGPANVYGVTTHSNNVLVSSNYTLTVGSNLVASNIVACNITVSNITACNITYINETVTNTTESGTLTITGTGALMVVGPSTFSNNVTMLSNATAACNLSVGGTLAASNVLLSNVLLNGVTSVNNFATGTISFGSMGPTQFTVSTYSNVSTTLPATFGNTVTISSNVTASCNLTVGSNLGIGTSNPLYTLDVASCNQNTSTIVAIHNMTNPLSNIYNCGELRYVITDNSSIPFNTFSVIACRENWQGDYNTSLAFCSAGGSNNERMRITSSGNVGIGTTSPAFPLQIEKTATLFTGATGATIGTTKDRLVLGANTNAATGGAYSVSLTCGNTANQTINFNGAALQPWNNGANDLGSSANQWGNIYATNCLTFPNADGGKRVAIWTSASNAYSGIGKMGNCMELNMVNNTDFIKFGSFSNANSTGSDELMRLTGTGNLGIGTTNPGYKLDVNGTINCLSNICSNVSANNSIVMSGIGGELTFKGWSGANALQCAVVYGNGNYSTSATSNDVVMRTAYRLHLQSGTGAAAITIGSNNNVGIGQSSPAYPLDVVGTSRLNGDVYMNGFANCYGFRLSYSNQNSNDQYGLGQPVRIDHYYGHNSSPTFASNASITLAYNNSIGGWTALNCVAGSNTTFAVQQNGDMIIGTACNETYIECPGQVHFRGNSKGSSQYYNMNFSIGSNGTPSSLGTFQWWTGGDGGSGGTQRMTLTAGGALGIATNNPQYTLDVNGTTRCTNGAWVSSDQRVKLNIADADLAICYSNIKNIPLRRFEWDSNVFPEMIDKNTIGWIAQEVQSVYPKGVNATDSYGFSNFLDVNPDLMYKTMYGALQLTMAKLENIQNFLQSKYTDFVAM